MSDVLQEQNTIEVEVDGFSVKVDRRRLRSWRAVKLVAFISDTDNAELQRTAALVELAEMVLGDSFQAVIDHYGGEDLASFEDVSKFVNEVFAAVDAKN